MNEADKKSPVNPYGGSKITLNPPKTPEDIQSMFHPQDTGFLRALNGSDSFLEELADRFPRLFSAVKSFKYLLEDLLIQK